MITQPTLESEIYKLEQEVVAFKKSQPFYDGQFSVIRVGTGNPYDFEFTATNTGLNQYDILMDYNASNQPNAIFEPFVQLSNVTLAIEILDINYVDYAVIHHVSTSEVQSAEVNINVQANAGDIIRVKMYAVTTNFGSWSYSGNLR